MALRTASDEIHTWLNRFPGDTENFFTWKAGYIRRGDFNGDGITDYIDGVGNIYRGIQNGQPPEKEPVFKYNFSGIIYDLNNDGFDDILWRSDGGGYGVVARILYGGSDFTKFAQVNIERTAPFDTNRSVDQIYFTSEGEARFLVYHTFKNGLDIIKGYEIYKVTWEKGGTQPAFEKLSEHKNKTSSPDFAEYTSDAIYQSKYHNKTFLFLRESLNGDYFKNNVHIFDITDNNFTRVLKFRLDNANFNMLEQSVDGDEYEDWYNNQGNQKLVFSGGAVFDSIPKLQTKGFAIGAIGDVSGDGISDLAASLYDFPTATFHFRIVNGLDLTTGISNDNTQSPLFSFTETSPHPINMQSVARISVNILSPAQYTLSLYTLDGKLTGHIFQGWLDSGSQDIPLNLAPYNLSPGSYLLRMSNGVEAIQRTIIITN
jgi:hypothetical protein